MSAFEETPLALALRGSGIVSVAIVGIAAEVGIEPTARHGPVLLPCRFPTNLADASPSTGERIFTIYNRDHSAYNRDHSASRTHIEKMTWRAVIG
jgi:hypothetical protein